MHCRIYLHTNFDEEEKERKGETASQMYTCMNGYTETHTHTHFQVALNLFGCIDQFKCVYYCPNWNTPFRRLFRNVAIHHQICFVL